jgi:NAD(P)-dependent dehydrogenase (short-subunit alcohol dehydrogenase family)
MDADQQDEQSPADRENAATHNSPRTWLLTSALSPLAVRLIRHLLAHGDCVVACLPPHEIDDEDRGAEFSELIEEVKSSRADRAGWRERIRGIRCDGRVMGSCGAAIAEAVSVFGRIDILLCCKSEGKFLIDGKTWIKGPILTYLQPLLAQLRSSPQHPSHRIS